MLVNYAVCQSAIIMASVYRFQVFTCVIVALIWSILALKPPLNSKKVEKKQKTKQLASKY